jgi:hypothetical protein
MNRRPRIIPIVSAIVVSGVGLGGCGSLDIGNLNDPGIEEFQNNPTPAKIAAAATGLLVQIREDIGANNGYVSHLGILGRESYNFDAADPRFVTSLLAGPLSPGDRVFGGHFWEIEYRNIRNANLLLAATDVVAGMDPEEKEAVRGFAKTIAALEYLIVINTHDTNGAVIQRSTDLHQLDPIVTNKDEVFAHIKLLLDEARTHLQAGGSAFPFQLGSGFRGFDTPAAFLQANRALKARVDVYSGDNAAALTALGESFLSADPLNPGLDRGIYHAFGTGTGDTINRLNDPNIFAHPSVKMQAEIGPNAALDKRVATKIKMVEAGTSGGLTSDQAFTLYTSPSSPISIIRNEELILLRAEASYATNLPQAIADINFIRVHSGGLPPRLDLTPDNILDELLKQRFYSLLFEGGHRWLDMRRHDRLEQLPNDRPEGSPGTCADPPVSGCMPAHRIHARFPIPLNETNARMPSAP